LFLSNIERKLTEYALLQGSGGFELVAVLFAPLRGELALEAVLQQRLAIHLELRLGGPQVFDALVQF
jgi:hypothetical protein